MTEAPAPGDDAAHDRDPQRSGDPEPREDLRVELTPQDVAENALGDWALLGRFRNWAEFGFVESLLHEAEIATGMWQQSDHDSHFSKPFAVVINLYVPRSRLDESLDLMHARLGDMTAEDDDEGVEHAIGRWMGVARGMTAPARRASRAAASQPGTPVDVDFDHFERGGLNWWFPAIGLAMVFSAAAWFTLRSKTPAAMSESEAALWTAMDAFHEPLLESATPGKPARMIWFDRDKRVLYVRVDADNNGTFEESFVIAAPTGRR